MQDSTYLLPSAIVTTYNGKLHVIVSGSLEERIASCLEDPWILSVFCHLGGTASFTRISEFPGNIGALFWFNSRLGSPVVVTLKEGTAIASVLQVKRLSNRDKMTCWKLHRSYQ